MQVREFFPSIKRVGPNRRAGEKGGHLKPYGKFNDEAKRKFLELCLEHGPHVSRHAYAVGVSPATEIRHRKKDPEYAAAFEHMQEMWKARLEEEVIRRGRDGWDEPVFYQGAQVGVVRKYSDTLLMALVKKYDPQYWDKNQVDLTVNGGVLVVGAAHGTVEEWRDYHTKRRIEARGAAGEEGEGPGEGPAPEAPLEG